MMINDKKINHNDDTAILSLDNLINDFHDENYDDSIQNDKLKITRSIDESSQSKNQILIQMLQFQRKNLLFKLRLDLEDIRRIVLNINKSIFDDNNCCIWQGYITNTTERSRYINFYFKHRKIALHRLLYINYVGDIDKKNYLKFICQNKGICCNVKHVEKCTKNTQNSQSTKGTNISHKQSTMQVMKLANNATGQARSKFIVVLSD